MSSQTKRLYPLQPRAPLLQVGIPSVAPQWTSENGSLCVSENMRGSVVCLHMLFVVFCVQGLIHGICVCGVCVCVSCLNELGRVEGS